MFRKQFVEVVTATGMATATDLRSFTAESNKAVVGEFELLNLPSFDEAKFAKKMAEKYKLELVDLSKEQISKDVLTLMSKKQVLQFRAIPIRKSDQKISVCVFDPSVTKQIAEIRNLLKKEVELLITTISEWKGLFGEVRESVDELLESVEEVGAGEVEKDAVGVDDIGQDVIQFVNKLLVEAFSMKASDIHIETYEKIFRIRMRVDGSLIQVAKPSRLYQLPVVSRIKIMASMDIAERRLPQDGRIKLKVGGMPIDFRVSSLPTLFGEKIVLRLLDQENLQLDMTKLGFEEKQLNDFKAGISQPYGMCLVVGPTGSGKTTTLYSALSEMNNPQKNLVTAEDPVEFNLEGINQVNVRDDIGLSFCQCAQIISSSRS